MKVKVLGVRLLTKEEYLQNRDCIGSRKPWFWLQDKCGEQSDLVAAVYIGDVVGFYEVDYKFGVVPGLVLEKSTLPVGSKLEYGLHSFTVLPKGLAVCDKALLRMAFREDWKADDAGVYERSDVEKWLKRWYGKFGDTAEATDQE